MVRKHLTAAAAAAVTILGSALVACASTKADPNASGPVPIEPVPASNPPNSTAEPSLGQAGSTTTLTLAGSNTPTTGSRPAGPQAGSPGSGLGWELTAANTGLARIGLACAALPVYAGADRPEAGAVISGRRIQSTLDLSAGGITIERSCIQPKSALPGLPVVTTTNYQSCQGNSCAVTPTMVAIRDSEIDGSLIDTATIAMSCAFEGVGTLERNHIHDVGSGICFAPTGTRLDAVASGNYVHKLRAWGDPATSGSHNESFTIRDFDTSTNPSRRATVVGNRLEASSGNDTGCLFIQTYAGNIDHVLIESNLLEGNAYQLILEAGYGHVYGRSIRAVNNRFSGTGFGPAYVDSKGLGYGWSEWRDNYLNDPSRPGNRGQPVAEPR